MILKVILYVAMLLSWALFLKCCITRYFIPVDNPKRDTDRLLEGGMLIGIINTVIFAGILLGILLSPI